MWYYFSIMGKVIKYRSGWEKFIANLFVKHKVAFEYETHNLNYTKEYTPDFILPNGIMIEAKGYFKPQDRTKMLQVKKSNPQVDIRMWFQKDNKATKKMSYTDWCKKHGFKYHVGATLPKKWINEKPKKK